MTTTAGIQKQVHEESTGTPAPDSLDAVPRARLDSIRGLYASGRLDNGDLVHLLAVLDGAKSGASLTDAAIFSGSAPFPGIDDTSWMAHNPLYRLVETLDLPRKVIVSQFTPSEGILHVYVARSDDLLDLCPEFEDGSRQTREIERDAQPEYGAFLGVPEPDRAWWLERDRSIEAVADATPLCETVECELAPGELRAAKQIPYCPEPSVAGVERAIDVGQRYVAAADAFDDAIAVDVGTRAVDEHAERDSFWL